MSVKKSINLIGSRQLMHTDSPDFHEKSDEILASACSQRSEDLSIWELSMDLK